MAEKHGGLLDSDVEIFLVALSDENRRKIVGLLDHGKELNVTEIAEHFKLSRSNISHHLGILRRSKILKMRKKGKESIYTANSKYFISFVKKYLVYLEARYGNK